MLLGDLLPSELHRLTDDQLGDVGETIAHLHHGQAPGEIRKRHAKQRGALELPQRLDLVLGIRIGNVLEPYPDLGSELLAARQLIENPLVHQLIEQQRKHDDLLGEELAARADLHQALQRRRILVEKREIGAAAADRFEYAQRPPQRRDRIGRVLERGQQSRHQDLQPAARRLAESLHDNCSCATHRVAQ